MTSRRNLSLYGDLLSQGRLSPGWPLTERTPKMSAEQGNRHGSIWFAEENRQGLPRATIQVRKPLLLVTIRVLESCLRRWLGVVCVDSRSLLLLSRGRATEKITSSSSCPLRPRLQSRASHVTWCSLVPASLLPLSFALSPVAAALLGPQLYFLQARRLHYH